MFVNIHHLAPRSAQEQAQLLYRGPPTLHGSAEPQWTLPGRGAPCPRGSSRRSGSTTGAMCTTKRHGPPPQCRDLSHHFNNHDPTKETRLAHVRMPPHTRGAPPPASAPDSSPAPYASGAPRSPPPRTRGPRREPRAYRMARVAIPRGVRFSPRCVARAPERRRGHACARRRRLVVAERAAPRGAGGGRRPDDVRELHRLTVARDAEAEQVLAADDVVLRRVAGRRDAERLRLEPLREVPLYLLAIHEHERVLRDLRRGALRGTKTSNSTIFWVRRRPAGRVRRREPDGRATKERERARDATEPTCTSCGKSPQNAIEPPSATSGSLKKTYDGDDGDEDDGD